MYQKVLAAILGLVFLAAPLAIVLPFLLWFFTDPFPGRLWFSILFSALAAEKVLGTFIHVPREACAGIRRDITTVTVGVSYTLVFYLAIILYFQRGGVLPFPWISGVGAGLYAVAVALRHWTFSHLGNQWAFHLDQDLGVKRSLIEDGPYAYVRHPLYTSAILECLGVALIFQSLMALAVAVLVFIPCELHRAYYEEGFLRKTFGPDYDRYSARVRGVVPLPRGIHNRKVI